MAHRRGCDLHDEHTLVDREEIGGQRVLLFGAQLGLGVEALEPLVQRVAHRLVDALARRQHGRAPLVWINNVRRLTCHEAVFRQRVEGLVG